MFYTSLLKYGISEEDVIAYSKNFNMPEDENRFDFLISTIFYTTYFIRSVIIKNTELFSKIDKLVQSKKFQDILWDTFLSYIRRHQQLMTYMEDVDDFFSYYFIVKLPMYMLYIILILFLWILVSEKLRFKF